MMATKNSVLVLIENLVTDLQDSQSITAKKANTVTSAIGTVITVLLAGAAYWLETATDSPAWLPTVIFILGMLATTFGVSQTKNGITDSVATKLKSELARRTDLEQALGHETESLVDPHIAPPVVPPIDPPEVK